MKSTSSIRKPQPRFAFLLSLLLGGVFAATSWIYGDANFLSHPYETFVEACAASIIGVIVGLICSPFVIVWLARKRLVLAGVLLLLGVTPVIPLIMTYGRAIGIESAIGIVAVIVSVFILSCKALSIYLSDIVFDPPNCPACGYDLTGNESGACSECGTEFDPKILSTMNNCGDKIT